MLVINDLSVECCSSLVDRAQSYGSLKKFGLLKRNVFFVRADLSAFADMYLYRIIYFLSSLYLNEGVVSVSLIDSSRLDCMFW